MEEDSVWVERGRNYSGETRTRAAEWRPLQQAAAWVEAVAAGGGVGLSLTAVLEATEPMA